MGLNGEMRAADHKRAGDDGTRCLQEQMAATGCVGRSRNADSQKEQKEQGPSHEAIRDQNHILGFFGVSVRLARRGKCGQVWVYTDCAPGCAGVGFLDCGCGKAM